MIFFPFDYLDDYSKLIATDSLTNEDISDENYQHILTVWNTFECQTLGDYHDLYLQVDCLLLDDVFEIFRRISMQNVGLDPAHYFSLPKV